MPKACHLRAFGGRGAGQGIQPGFYAVAMAMGDKDIDSADVNQHVILIVASPAVAVAAHDHGLQNISGQVFGVAAAVAAVNQRVEGAASLQLDQRLLQHAAHAVAVGYNADALHSSFKASCMARARWLTAFLASPFISAKVRPFSYSK